MPRGGPRKGAGRKRIKPVDTPVKRAAAKQSKAPQDVAETPVNPPTVPPPAIDNPFNLSPKELIFVECYTGISKFNASDAYERAGYKGKRGKVSGLAARLIANDRVGAAVAARLGSRLRTLQMDGDEALEGISRIGRADVRKVVDDRGNVRDISQLDDDTADAIQSIKVVERRVQDGVDEGGKPKYETEYTKEFKFYDKLRARELMAKVAGKLSDFGGLKGPKGEPLTARRVIIELDEASGAPS